MLPPGIYDADAIREKIVNPLLGDRLAQPVFNGFIWRYLFSAEIFDRLHLRYEGAYLEDELFLMEYFCNARRLAVTETPLYRYLQNPASATHKYMKDFQQVFGPLHGAEGGLGRPVWPDAPGAPSGGRTPTGPGLLIAIGNEYAPGNPKTLRQRQETIQALCARPDMAHAIRTLSPAGMSRNKQLAAKLVRGGRFWLLSQLYRIKNRI